MTPDAQAQQIAKQEAEQERDRLRGEVAELRKTRVELIYEELLSIRAARQEAERVIRKQLWLNHGCPIAALYGDDGEMQCNNGRPYHLPLDFKRQSLAELIPEVLAFVGIQAVEAEQRAATLTAALRKYGAHEKDCDLTFSTNQLTVPCSCGLDAALGDSSSRAKEQE